MSRFFSLAVMVALVTVISWGCTNSDAPVAATEDEHAGHDHDGEDHDHAALGTICGSCGEAKGTDSCCSESAEKCASCELNKGSLLCCVQLDASVAGKDLCGSCGQVAGSDTCCVEGAEKCECGMAKGSPLCCKLKNDEK